MSGDQLAFQARTQNEQAEIGSYTESKVDIHWQPSETAVIICDMWDHHWCRSAETRAAELAPRMNVLVGTLRADGVRIIHAPSDTMAFYTDHPARRAFLATVQNQEKSGDAMPMVCNPGEGILPVDDSDGGCDCQPHCPEHQPWTRQMAGLTIDDGDWITDSADVFYALKACGIRNVLIMGVHTNMCILARPFAIRELVKRGLNVVLARDLTDSMYNPAMAPYVDHFTGTDLIIEHIEKYWCPTITSDQIIEGPAFRFHGDKRQG